jgi:hypothetical protein
MMMLMKIVNRRLVILFCCVVWCFFFYGGVQKLKKNVCLSVNRAILQNQQLNSSMKRDHNSK